MLKYSNEFEKRMKEFNLYHGFETEETTQREIIILQDEVDERFCISDYFDMVSTTLIYHQIVERMLVSLVEQERCLQELIKYPQTFAIDKRKLKSFFDKCNYIQNNCDFGELFPGKDLFIKKCRKFNNKRNKLAHEAALIGRKSIRKEMCDVKEKYHEIQKTYEGISIEIYNYIHARFPEELLTDYGVMILKGPLQGCGTSEMLFEDSYYDDEIEFSYVPRRRGRILEEIAEDSAIVLIGSDVIRLGVRVGRIGAEQFILGNYVLDFIENYNHFNEFSGVMRLLSVYDDNEYGSIGITIEYRLSEDEEKDIMEEKLRKIFAWLVYDGIEVYLSEISFI